MHTKLTLVLFLFPIIVPDKKVGIVAMINTWDGTAIHEMAKLLIEKFAN